jgi:carbon starvation protein
LIQDFFGEVYKPLKKTDSLWASVFASAFACFMWGYLLYSGDIGSIWALFGVSNQLMASVGLIIGATVILKIADKRRYMLTCLIPLAYLYVTVNYAGYWMITNVYLNPEAAGYSVLNGILSIIMLILGLVILGTAIKKWAEILRNPDLRYEASVSG